MPDTDVFSTFGWAQDEIAEVVGLDQSTIAGIIENIKTNKINNSLKSFLKQGDTVGEGSWISAIRAKQRAGRDSLIYKLSFLGWTQDEIAEMVGVTQERIAEIINNIKTNKIYNSLKSFLKQGDTVGEAAGKLYLEE